MRRVRSTAVTGARLSGWICNGNRNPQHAVADRQSNFQACSLNHADISVQVDQEANDSNYLQGQAVLG
jgi:hypothetical protein